MTDQIKVGERVQVNLGSKSRETERWFVGTVVRIDPYSAYRSFYWVELDKPEPMTGGSTQLISVLNPKNIRKV